MAGTLIRLNFRIAIAQLIKQWWRIILMVFVGLYILFALFGFTAAFVGLGFVSSVPLDIRANLVLFILGFFTLPYVLFQSVTTTSSQISPQNLVYYLPYTPKLARAFLIMTLLSMQSIIILLIALSTTGFWVSAGKPLALLLYIPGLLFATLITVASSKLLWMFNSLQQTAKRKIVLQAITAIGLLVFVAAFCVGMLAGTSALDKGGIEGIVTSINGNNHGIYLAVTLLLAVLPPTAPISLVNAMILGNWVIAPLSLLGLVVGAALIWKYWPVAFRKNMEGEVTRDSGTQSTKAVAGAAKSGHKDTRNLWPGAGLVRWLLPNPGTQVHFSRQLIYYRRDPRGLVILALPGYITVIFGAMAYFQHSFYGAELPYSKVQAVVFCMAVLGATLISCRWYMDSTAYWYQLIANFSTREDIKSRLMAGSVVLIPFYLVLTLALALVFGLSTAEIGYSVINMFSAHFFAFGVLSIFASFAAQPGPAPGASPLKNSFAGNSGGSLLITMVVSLGSFVCAGLLVGISVLVPWLISFAHPLNALAVLVIRLLVSLAWLYLAYRISAVFLAKRQVALLQIVKQWPGHMYSA